MSSTSNVPSNGSNATSNTMAAIIATLPLGISVIPWGILCGTLCIEAGLTSFQAQLMSLAVFAGAAQLAGISIFGSAGSWSSLLNSTTMISIRHVLYSATYKEQISKLPFYKRVLFAFLLTDEMFAVAQAEQAKTGKFDYWYAVVSGFTFYVIWNIATFVGIFSAHLLGDIDGYGFDFAIAATFIAMIVPMIKDNIMLLAVLASAASALLFAYLGMTQGLIFSALIGMGLGAFLSRIKTNGQRV